MSHPIITRKYAWKGLGRMAGSRSGSYSAVITTAGCDQATLQVIADRPARIEALEQTPLVAATIPLALICVVLSFFIREIKLRSTNGMQRAAAEAEEAMQTELTEPVIL